MNKPSCVGILAIGMLAATGARAESDPWTALRFLEGKWEGRASGEPGKHEDFGMYSYDKALKKVVLRQFHVEGFVNEYTLDSVGGDGKLIEFTTVRIENIAAGWRAKEAYHILSPDEFVETFSLAAPGKDFEKYSETHLKRVK